MLGREGDPNSNGRNMPEHFSSRELHLVSQTACTGTQFLPAVGMAKGPNQRFVVAGGHVFNTARYLGSLTVVGGSPILTQPLPTLTARSLFAESRIDGLV